MLRHVNRKSKSLIQFIERGLEPGWMSLQHVIASDPQLRQVFTGKSERRHQRLKISEAYAAIIIHAEKRGGFMPSFTQKTFEHKRVNLRMRKGRDENIPGQQLLIRLKESPVL